MPTRDRTSARPYRLTTLVALTLLLRCGSLLVAADNDGLPGNEDRPEQPAWRTLFDGKSLKHWRVIKLNDFEDHGEVTVKRGEIQLAKGQPATGIAYAGKVVRDNYEISLDTKRTEGRDFFCGLTFPVGKEYCTLILGGWGGGTTGLSNVNNFSADENDTSSYFDFQNGQWYTVRLRVSAERISAWIGKEQIVDLPRADNKFTIWFEQEPARPLGIATWNTAAALRNIRLREVRTKN